MTIPFFKIAEAIKARINKPLKEMKYPDTQATEDAEILCMAVDIGASTLDSLSRIEKHLDRIATALEKEPEIINVIDPGLKAV